MADSVAAMRSWIIARIQEISELADQVRATAYDIEDPALFDATTHLAEDLDAFTARLASRLAASG